MRKKSSLIGLAALVAVLGLSGCAKDNSIVAPEAETPPSLPSVSTMDMDLGLFESAQISPQDVQRGTLAQPSAASPDALKLNFLNAAVRVLFLDVVVYSALAHPVAAFATAIHSVPQYQPDGSWLWTYIFVDREGVEYSIYLRGEVLDTTVAWSMEVSSTDPAMLLDHFLWFDGEVQKGNSSGYWQFYEPADPKLAAATEGVPCIRIDWENNSRVDGRLAFLVNKPDVPESGSTLIFDEKLEGATLEFYDATTGDTGTIVANRDGSGSIQWPDYNDGEKGCWDVHQFDVDCP